MPKVVGLLNGLKTRFQLRTLTFSCYNHGHPTALPSQAQELDNGFMD